jgi:hypothetical protein
MHIMTLTPSVSKVEVLRSRMEIRNDLYVSRSYTEGMPPLRPEKGSIILSVVIHSAPLSMARAAR